MWRSIYIYNNISLIFSQNEKILDDISRKNQNAYYTYNNVFSENCVVY
jgi:hypothetical protein